jgi:CRISPR type IV-associated protein Csf2
MHALAIRGHLLATTPWHVGDGADNNVTRTMKALVVEGAETADGLPPDRPPTLASVPLVPSNSIRGRLRRQTLGFLTEALVASGQHITRETYQMLSNGGMIGGREAGELTVGELVRARRQLHVGLWGGGPRLLPSGVTTCDLMPICHETIAAGKVPVSLQAYAPVRTRRNGDQIVTEPARGRDLVVSRMFKRNDDMMQLTADAHARLAALGPEADAAIAEYQAIQFGHRESRKSAKESLGDRDARTLSEEDRDSLRKKDLVNFLEMEVVVPGTVWPFELRLADYASPAQIALLARGVERMLNEQKIGGYGRWGFGQCRAKLDVWLLDELIGTLRYDEALGRHVLAFSDRAYDDALSAELASLAGEELDAFSLLKVNRPAGKTQDTKPGRKKTAELAEV